jgi:two-component system sensor histidine kinase HydH
VREDPVSESVVRIAAAAPEPAERALWLPAWHWLGAGVGVLSALIDLALILQVGVEMRLGGRDATAGVLAFLCANYAVLGYAVGRTLQGRARARRDAETIARQLRELERAQRELVQQEKLAAIGRLAAGVAHEVRNPLGVIRASAALVQEGFEQGDDSWRACDFICQEIDRLNALITSLLSFARPTEPRRKTVSIGELIERALRLAGDELRRRGIAVDVEDASALPALRADPDLVSQLIYDLLSNAGDAAGAGGRIAVRSARAAGALRVEVADSGAGVAPELLAQVFEPFFTTKAQGTGLGLPMAERIAQAHGGTLACVTGRGLGPGGRGACFRLELPLEAA